MLEHRPRREVQDSGAARRRVARTAGRNLNPDRMSADDRHADEAHDAQQAADREDQLLFEREVEPRMGPATTRNSTSDATTNTVFAIGAIAVITKWRLA